MSKLRLKLRTAERDGRQLATATIWVGDSPVREFSTLDLALVEHPGDPVYQAWADAATKAFASAVSRATGIEGLKTKRRKPRYDGE